MKRRRSYSDKYSKNMLLVPAVFFGIILVICLVYNLFFFKVNTEGGTVYKCNDHVFSFVTKITITKDGKDFGTVKGDHIRFFTDPLSYKGNDGTTAKASDSYNLITQDDHDIMVNGNYIYTMRGDFGFFQDKYTILNESGAELATIKTGMFSTHFDMVSNTGTVIATFYRPLLRRDYTVVIYDHRYTDEAVLLTFASFVSDRNADNTSSSSNNND